MSEAVIIYLYLTVGNVLGVLVGLAVAYLGLLGVGSIMVAMNADTAYPQRIAPSQAVKNWLNTMKWVKGLTAAAVIFLLSAVYPSKEDLKFIVGGAALWNTSEYVLNNDEAKKLPDNVLKAMNSFLEQVNETPTKEAK